MVEGTNDKTNPFLSSRKSSDVVIERGEGPSVVCHCLRDENVKLRYPLTFNGQSPQAHRADGRWGVSGSDGAGLDRRSCGRRGTRDRPPGKSLREDSRGHLREGREGRSRPPISSHIPSVRTDPGLWDCKSA